MSYIRKQEVVYQNKVNSNVFSTYNCKMAYLRILYFVGRIPTDPLTGMGV